MKAKDNSAQFGFFGTLISGKIHPSLVRKMIYWRMALNAYRPPPTFFMKKQGQLRQLSKYFLKK